MTSRPGTTLMELLLVLAILGTVGGIALPRLSALAAAFALRDAQRQARFLFARARTEAQTSGQRTALVILPPSSLAIVRAGDTLARVNLEASLVRIEGSRDSMAYSASGLAWGASNLRLILRRSALADTLLVSRLGRVR
jgi:type II secretory pathway pseudopilin PulG